MSDPVIHGIIGAQFGDLEVDVGTSVRWLQYLVDDFHITDVNLGTQRYWVVDWDKTFPECEHDTIGINFFADPVAFRKEQWRLAKDKLNIQPTDWVVWIDAHEGLSFDNTSLPTDYNTEPFLSWLWREVARAEALPATEVVLPFFAWVRDEEIQNITYDLPDPAGGNIPDGVTFPVQQALSVPYYEANQGLKRLMQASVLDDVGFNWTSLDTPATPSLDVKAQVVSYGYGHWQPQDIPAGATEVPAMTADNDDGWKMRQKLSQARPLASFPTVTWDATDTDLVGLPGPWGDDTHTIDAPTITEEFAHTPPDASMAGITTPLYQTIVRINLRDGIWYLGGSRADTIGGTEMGNIPLYWDSTNQRWDTHYDTATWSDQGVASWNFPEVPGKVYEIPQVTYLSRTTEDENFEEVTIHEALVDWLAPLTTGSEPLINYTIEVEKDGVVSTAGVILPKKTDFRHTPLDFATYRYRVYAVNDVGSSAPSEWSDPLIWDPVDYYQEAEPSSPEVDETWQRISDGGTGTWNGASWDGYLMP